MVTALGINGRNAVIARRNPRWAVAAAKDKLVTKQRLGAAGIPVPETLLVVRDRRGIRELPGSDLPSSWVVKPSRGSGGRGVIVVVDALSPAGAWTTPSGGLTSAGLRRHLSDILSGDYSSGDDDVAMFEPLLRPHPLLADLTTAGLPDVRVVCDGTRPLLAMTRIPTVASRGRGNLHQGGIGAAIDLDDGRILRAAHRRREISRHPDTGQPLVGTTLPLWNDVVDIASRCSAASGLGYLGVDVVVDADRGPLVLEVNSHPGLEIQNITGRALRPSRSGPERRGTVAVL